MTMFTAKMSYLGTMNK